MTPTSLRNAGFIGAALLFFPYIASAQTGGNLGNITSLVRAAKDIIDLLIPIFIAVALLVFFWGLIVYIKSAGSSADKAAEGKTFMIYGVIALFVMVSVWGLIGFLGRAVGVQQETTIPIPTVRDR